METFASFAQAISEFRELVPAASATAQAIDRGEPWDCIALNAINDGYLEFADELGRFFEACLRQSF